MEKECKICSESKSEDSFIKLTCEHSFCLDCLEKDWTIKIQENQVDGSILKCPDENCSTPINFYVLKLHLKDKIFEKYEKALLENMEPTEKEKEKSINCPKCNILAVIWKDADYFDCAECKKRFCAKDDCKGDWEKHKNILCAEYKKKFCDQKFDAYLKAQNIKKCPVCNINIEKIRNCNTVRCESSKCQKKTLFCYLCGKLLKENEKSTHFVNGEYGKECAYLRLQKSGGKVKTYFGLLQKYKIEILCGCIPCCWCYLPCWIFRNKILNFGNKVLNLVIKDKSI